MKSRYQSRRYEHSVLLRFLGHVFNSKIFMVSDYTEIVTRALFAVWSHRSAAGSILATSDLAS
jgi:hypothetical protein